jgi:hypothetical protein
VLLTGARARQSAAAPRRNILIAAHEVGGQTAWAIAVIRGDFK